MLMLTLFFQVTEPAGCGRCCREKFQVSSGYGLCVQYRCGERFLFSCESSLVGFMTRHGLVDRFRLDHPGREMWTWLDSSPSAKVGSYLDQVLERRADIDFVS